MNAPDKCYCKKLKQHYAIQLRQIHNRAARKFLFDSFCKVVKCMVCAADKKDWGTIEWPIKQRKAS